MSFVGKIWRTLLAFIDLAWALPTAFVVLIIEIGHQLNVSLPVPFLLILTSVTIAGAMGGIRAGTSAGLMAVAFVVHAYWIQFGPSTLTGGIIQTMLGSVLYFGTGILLGVLRDQRDASIKTLRQQEQSLAYELHSEKTERDRQSDILADREMRLNTATRIAGIGHFSFEAFTGKCTYCSEQHAANLGMSQQEFLAIASGPVPNLSHIHPDDRSDVMDAIAALNSGKAQTFEFRTQRPKAGIRFIRQIEVPNFDAAGVVIEHNGVSMDLTELRLAEARIRQSQRIEAIGTLTGGVAHDFNNLLAVILGNLELCLEVNPEDERIELIRTAINATMRGAGLTKNLLSFARRAHLEPTRLDLNQVIHKTMAWSTRVLPETIIIENSLMAGIWPVELDATSVENALVNILLNARDAMLNGGKVTIETANMRIGEEYVDERNEDIEPGRYVMLAISDTGIGIPADQLQKIFEPFHTTKPAGEGSGLGLSMVQGFIKQSGGAIRVYSEIGVGTTFKLYFKASEHGKYMSVNELPTPIHSSHGPKKVLVAEDETEVMAVLQRVLEDAGYVVTSAASGDKALEIFKSSGPFDLLLTDIVMPGVLQGPALAKELRVLDPELPSIFLSGYASEATVHGNGLRPSDIRLMKPTTRDDLLTAVSKALETGK